MINIQVLTRLIYYAVDITKKTTKIFSLHIFFNTVIAVLTYLINDAGYNKI